MTETTIGTGCQNCAGVQYAPFKVIRTGSACYVCAECRQDVSTLVFFLMPEDVEVVDE